MKLPRPIAYTVLLAWTLAGAADAVACDLWGRWKARRCR